jgi:nucleotide-binding universal stress UspA family protein
MTAMKKNMLTIAVLPFVKAQILMKILAERGISCSLEDLNLLEGTSSLAVRVQILDEDLEKAFPLLEEFLGKPSEKSEPDKKQERQVLVPVDFSPFSLKAAKVAFDICRLINARLILFHAYPNPVAYSVPFSDIYAFDTGLLAHLESAEKSAQLSMEEFLRDLIRYYSRETWTKVETEYILKAGDARDDILSFAHQNNVLLIVMGTQGLAESEIDIIGSVTAEIINASRVPVLAIPANTPDNISGSFRKILYATNFDNNDFTALDKLMHIFKPYDSEIHCVHVERRDEPVWNLAKLEGMKDILRSKYKERKFECHLLNGTDLMTETDKFISENQMDILALTSHKRNMIARFFNPSIARKMLFHSKIP